MSVVLDLGVGVLGKRLYSPDCSDGRSVSSTVDRKRTFKAKAKELWLPQEPGQPSVVASVKSMDLSELKLHQGPGQPSEVASVGFEDPDLGKS